MEDLKRGGMNTYAVYFHPLGTLASSLSSDTLFGAVCWGIAELKLKPALADWLRSQQNAPRFAFSSTFPFWQREGQKVHFYPRPINFRASSEDVQAIAQSAVGNGGAKKALCEAVALAKKLNKVSWLSEGVLTLLLKGELTPRMVLQSKDSFPIQGGALVLPAKKCSVKYHENESEAVFESGLPPTAEKCSVKYHENERWMASQPVLHNQIDRVRGSTVEGLLFYQSETSFAPGVGLWALLRAEKAEFEQLIHPALRYLADTGFGANRTTGKGHFRVEVLETVPALPVPKSVGRQMLLSRYLPAPEERKVLHVEDAGAAYRIRTVRAQREHKFPGKAGTASDAVYKRAVRMFEPGSILPLSPAEIYGRLAEVVTEEEGGPVFQSGAALTIPLAPFEGRKHG